MARGGLHANGAEADCDGFDPRFDQVRKSTGGHRLQRVQGSDAAER